MNEHENDQEPKVKEAVAYLEPRLPFRPRVGVVLGAGMGAYADKTPRQLAESYERIPGFPLCTVDGHQGVLVATDRCGIPTLIMQGRVHCYEGYSLEEVTFPVRVLAALGVEGLILTCTAGAIGKVEPGHLLLVEDHVNLMGDSPLHGSKKATFPGLIEMSEAYDPALLQVAEQVAHIQGIMTHRGVLACVPGPTYETKAEAWMMKQWGINAVTMSTVPEVIVARALRLRVLALALIANQSGANSPDRDTHAVVLLQAQGKKVMVASLLDGLLRSLATGFPETLQ